MKNIIFEDFKKREENSNWISWNLIYKNHSLHIEYDKRNGYYKYSIIYPNSKIYNCNLHLTLFEVLILINKRIKEYNPYSGERIIDNEIKIGRPYGN